MNKDEMIELLRTDVEGWNEFRKKNPHIDINLERISFCGINLRKANLVGTNFYKANLEGANFEKADLRGANLTKANLTNSIFFKAALRGAILSETVITDAIFAEAHLRDVDMRKAQLRGSNFKKAFLREANLQTAILERIDLTSSDLQGAWLQKAILTETNLTRAYLQKTCFTSSTLNEVNFTEAKFYETRFSSRSQLNNIIYPLTRKQVSDCIFKDEEEFYRSQAEKNYSTKKTNDHTIKSLQINFKDHTSWTPRDLSLLLGAIHLSYSNIFYLLNTDETDLNRTKYVINNNAYFPPLNYDISINQIRTGSLWTEITKLNIEDIPKNIEIVTYALLVLGLFLKAITTYTDIKLKNEQLKHLKEARKNNILVIPENHIAIKKSQLRQHQEYFDKLTECDDIDKIASSTKVKSKTVAANKNLFSEAIKPIARAYFELTKSYKTNPEITLPDQPSPKEDEEPKQYSPTPDQSESPDHAQHPSDKHRDDHT